MRHSIGVDIGATKMLAGIVREDGVVLHRIRVNTPAHDGAQVVRTLVTLLAELQTCEVLKTISLAGVGIGTAGQVDFVNGCVLSGTPNILNWANVELRKTLQPITGLPVWVDNDVNVQLLAEASLGVAVAKRHVVMLSLGTGIGGAAMMNGELLHGSWGGAAEFGHMTVDFQGPLCNCGARGCLELFASGAGIAAQMAQRLGLVEGQAKELTGEMVFRKAKQGDVLANEVLDQAIAALTAASVNLAHSFNPEMIVFAGGIMAEGNGALDRVRQAFAIHGISSLLGTVTLANARFGSDAGLVGAALQPFHYHSHAR
ncbi:ROK family protein [Alicyclobacillus fodiniaquatilis]|jgi:glucokinase|uniref:ROK family protein n=1 Tax=Alicyclobacillus fodiniaquatilis TaxID=1661150 RepID=A0ABW4JJP6_9BACL